MMYILTLQEHAQIVDALENVYGKGRLCDAALAMLKAMKPVAQAAQPAQNHIEQYLEMVSTQPARVPWWMPIESAPKDGTRVLIKADCTVVAGWQNVFDDTFGWVVINDVWVPEHIATHWQPLPAAPSTKEQRNA